MCSPDDDTAASPPPRHPPFPASLPVYDAHCHPTDTMAQVSAIPHMRARCLTIMATRSQDQHLVAEVASELALPDRSALSDQAGKTGVVPAFGWHPWFSHQLYDDHAEEPTYSSKSEDDKDEAKAKHYTTVLSSTPSPEFIKALPTPTPLSTFISSTKERLKSYPLALIGEIGIDKAFRLPQEWDDATSAGRDETLTPGGREGRLLSPHRVLMSHQQAVLTAQLRLAGQMKRAVSVHGVQAHGVLHDTLAALWKGHEKEVLSRRQRRQIAPGAEDISDDGDEGDSALKPFPPRICLHSFSGSVEVLTQYLVPTIPAKIFFSFSACINMGTENGRNKIDEVLKMVPDDAVLVESDLHMAGDKMDSVLEEMYQKVCEVKGWDLEDGVKRIAKNYEAFIFGK